MIFLFGVAHKIVFFTKQVTEKTFGPASSYIVEGLRPNTEYFFSLAAISNRGTGAFTKVISQRTSQASM